MALPDTREPAFPTAREPEFSAAEIGALAHLYRGEVYRVSVFLLFEARRYRYFNVWRARARLLEPTSTRP
jgi:uncharacterized membrane protein